VTGPGTRAITAVSTRHSAACMTPVMAAAC
jgi:hypothetical protein